MNRRELFKLIVMTATGAEGGTATIVPPQTWGAEFVETATKKRVTEWGQLVDLLMADVPTGTWARLDATLKRTHSEPARYEVDAVRVTAPGAERY